VVDEAVSGGLRSSFALPVTAVMSFVVL